MKFSRSMGIIILLTGWLPTFARASDHYWAYTYKDIDVTAAGSARRAKDIAHNLHRLDLALAIVLGLQPDNSRPPTLVYAVPQTTFDLLWKKSDGSYSSTAFHSDFDTQILINASLDRDTPFFDAYAGYATSLLTAGYTFRFPVWFRYGLAQVSGASSVERKQVVIGGFVANRVRPLAQNGWIPLKTLFNMAYNDPQLQDREYLTRYGAECWFVVHEIVIEQMYRANFQQYFSHLDSGEEEPQAFAVSFNINYGNLDKELRATLDRGLLRLIKVAIPDEEDRAEPRSLSDSEAKGRLAVVAALHAVQIDAAIMFANEALAADPKNENALVAMAQVQLRSHDYPQALIFADRLCALNPLSQKGTAQCAQLYAQLLYIGAAKNGALGIDAPTLADRSRKYFESALALDSEDLASWGGLAYLLTTTRDVESAKAFLPRGTHEWAMHPRNEYLARSMAGLAATTDDLDTAIKFATVWRKNALTGTSSAEADAYLSRLKTRAERKRLGEEPIPKASPAALKSNP